MSDGSSCDSSTDAAITAECSVDAALEKSPSARAVLDLYGIDTCCGGRASIGAAALHAHVDPALLVEALNAAPGSGTLPTARALPQAKACGCGCR